MGGYAFEFGEEPTARSPSGTRRLCLTLLGISFVLQADRNLLPDISIQDINDKSKSTPFAKTIVCFQLGGFCVQILCRWQQRLMVPLLELNTAIHGCYAIALCALWWHKPLDMVMPFLIRAREGHRMAALLAVASIGRLRKDGRHTPRFEWCGSSTVVRRLPVPGRPVDIHRNDILFGFGFVGWKGGDVDINHCPITLSNAECECFRLAAEAMRKYGTRIDIDALFGREMLAHRVRNRLTIGNVGSQGVWCSLAIAGIVYGSIHLAIWNHPFHSGFEAWAWRASSAYIVAFSLAWIILWVILKFHASTVFLASALMASALIHFYVICRVYIVGAALYEVYYLPHTAFLLPRWAQYLP